jgi:hypothetical protein
MLLPTTTSSSIHILILNQTKFHPARFRKVFEKLALEADAAAVRMSCVERSMQKQLKIEKPDRTIREML